MKNGKVSVIVPVYNVEEYVGKCIESIINQTYTNLEILINNDGSTDNSYEICKFYAEKDARIKLFTQKNNGVSACRNRMLDVATGDYILFVDSDDWIYRQCIERLVYLLEKYNADISSCGYKTHQSSVRSNIEITTNNIELYNSLSFVSKMVDLRSNFKCFSWGRLFKKSIWNSLLFPEERIFEDMFTIPKAMLNANKIVYTNESLYFYNMRKGSLSHREFTIDQTDELDGYISIARYGYEKDYLSILNNSAVFFIYRYALTRVRILLNGRKITKKEKDAVRLKYNQYFMLFFRVILFKDFKDCTLLFDDLVPIR